MNKFVLNKIQKDLSAVSGRKYYCVNIPIFFTLSMLLINEISVITRYVSKENYIRQKKYEKAINTTFRKGKEEIP